MARAGAGKSGLFVLDWQQTAVDGVTGADPDWVRPGSAWRWSGVALRMDGAATLLPLVASPDAGQWRRRAARSVARLSGMPRRDAAPAAGSPPPFAPQDGFALLAEGRHFEARFIRSGPRLLLSLEPGLPPMGRDCVVTVVDRGHAARRAGGAPEVPGGIVAETLIDTPDGPRPADALRPGDRVLTGNGGVRALLWTGLLRYSGAELRRTPALRPLQVWTGRSSGPVLVAPGQGVQLDPASQTGAGAGQSVLARACDLGGGHAPPGEYGPRVLFPAHGVDYALLVLARPCLLSAGGTGLDSVRPGTLSPALRRRVCTKRAGPLPSGARLDAMPAGWRWLSPGEAALMSGRPIPGSGAD